MIKIIKNKIHNFGNILKLSIIDTVNHDGVEHAGYLAFLSIVSFFPLLIFIVAITGYVGQLEVANSFVEIFIANIPKNAAKALMPRINEIISGPPPGFLTIAFLGVIWTASSSVEGLRTILNRAYRVENPPTYIWRRLLSIAQFFLIIVTITIILLLLIILPAFWHKISDFLHLGEIFLFDLKYLRFFLFFLIILKMTSLLYFLVPNKGQKLTSALPGSFICVVLWICVGKILAFYLKNVDQINLIYGSIGGVIIALIFFYLIALIFIFGAEFNYHYANHQRKKS